MKLVIAAGIYPPDIGGPATYSQLIAREFSKRGIEIGVICYSDKTKDSPVIKEIDKDKDVIRISRKHNILKRYWLYYRSLLKIAKDADVIYAQGPLAAGLPAMLACKKLKKRCVIKIVGDYAWEQGVNQFGVKDLIELFQEKKYIFKIRLGIIRKIQKKVVKSADKVIMPSEFLKKIVKGWGIEENKIKVIYNAGPDLKEIEKIEPDKELMSKGDIIISAGRLEPWKGMGILISIMPDLLEEDPDFKLVIVGRGPEQFKLKVKSQKLKVDDAVKIIDKLPHEELMEYFKVSKIFVLNTGYEGFSHIILEAMACELPVITTNVCGNPEIVQDGYNGLLVEYNNKEQLKLAILKLWKDEKLREKFIENSKKTLEKFKLEDMINKTLNILKQ